MGYTDVSFLDTKEEHDKWHNGLYRGLKTHQPQNVVKELHIYDKGWRKWYGDDEHYHDFAVLGAYGVKAASVVLGLKALAALGL